MSDWLVYSEEFFNDLTLTTDNDKQRLSLLIHAAMEYVESYCNREFEKGTHTEICTVQPDGSVFIPHPPLVSISSIKTLSAWGTTANNWTPTWADYTGDIYFDSRGIVEGSFVAGEKVKFTYIGGFDPVPAPIKAATANLAKSAFEGSQGRVKSESLGSYSYTLEDVGKLAMHDQKILNQYKDRRC